MSGRRPYHELTKHFTAADRAWIDARVAEALAAMEPAHPYLAGQTLVHGDNLQVLKELPDDCVDLIYLDPPFNSNHFYVAAFKDKGRVESQLRDIWRWNVAAENAFQRFPHGPLLDCLRGIRLQAGDKSPMAAYAVFMAARLAEMHRILKPTGSIYLHCDPHANAYLRILLDTLFGAANFRNEIVWRIGWVSGFKTQKKGWIRNHDTILYYTKTAEAAKRFNKEYIPYPPDYVRRDGKKPTGKGVPIEDTWNCSENDILNSIMIMSFSNEKVGYPTQKPLKLLERIINASSEPGEIVLDPFCGCGTAADAAAGLGRKYLGIDISGIAVRVMQQRLESRGKGYVPTVYGLDWGDFRWEDFEERALLPRGQAADGVPGWAWAEDKIAALLNAVPNQQKTGDGGVDARYFGAIDIDRNEGIVIPMQVKMRRNAVGRPDLEQLLGAQTAMQNRGLHAPMSIMVSLYPPPQSLRVFAAEQGRVTLHTRDGGRQEYPKMQVLSVQEMLQHAERPALPPVDPRSLVGDTQDKMLVG